MKALVLIALLATPAFGKTHRDFQRGSDQVWPALLRFLRVDEKLKITEKDAAAGYILFEVVDGKRTFVGSAELAKLADDETRVVILIRDRPAYMESGLLDRFEQKLHDELG